MTPGNRGGKSGSNVKGGGGKARSVGAMGGSPNGAILDDSSEMELQRKQRFKAWAKGYRDKHLTPNKFEGMYPRPVEHWKES